MYIYSKKVLFSDIDATSRMSIYGVMNAMQDCVNINSESIGRGIDYMLRMKRSWFAIGWNISIKRLPKMFENIVVKTWPYKFDAFMGYRNVVIEDEAGEVIISADSLWTLVSTETGLPVKIREEDARGYDLEERYPMEPMKRKIKTPKETEQIDKVTVKKTNVDYNGHMSNGEYIRIAYDYLPMDAEIKGVKVEYKNQSKLNEALNINQYKEGNNIGYIISGEKDNDVKAIVCFQI